MRGRRPNPKKLKVATGNRSRRKPRSGVRLSGGSFPDPKFSSTIAERVFPRYKAQLKRLKILDPAHQFVLHQLSEQHGDVEACREAIRKFGRFESYYDKDGNQLRRKSAALLALEDADRRFQKTLELCGLTPVTINKVQPIDDDGESEPGSEFFQ